MSISNDDALEMIEKVRAIAVLGKDKLYDDLEPIVSLRNITLIISEQTEN